MRTLAIMAALVVISLLTAAPGDASTRASYRAKVNRICRSYTPKIRALRAKASTGDVEKDPVAVGAAQARLFAVYLQESLAVFKVPVPTAMRAKIYPIIHRTADAARHLQRAFKASTAAEAWKELAIVASLTKPLAGMYDRAGLRDCGSNQ